MRKLTLLLLAALSFPYSYAQNLREEIARDKQAASSFYKLYEFDGTPETPAPEGFKPFYVSHYGRHGSRWMISENCYTELVDMLKRPDSLGILTPLGKSVLARCVEIGKDGRKRAGELSPIGAAQHRGIGQRLIARYPEVFEGNPEVDARSTLRVRCVLSMASFCEALKEKNPNLQLNQSASLRNTYWLEFYNYETHDISPDYLKFWDKGLFVKESNDILRQNIDIDGKISQLFTSDPGWNKDQKLNFFVKLYELGCNQKGVGVDIDFYDIFSDEDLYWLSAMDSYRLYAVRGPHPQNGGITLYYSKLLLEDIINRAQDAIDGNGRAADLRFGHDINLMSIIPMMQIDDWHFTGLDPVTTGEKWQIGKLTPMAANLQFVFYRNPAGEVLLKVLHNEKEAHLPVPTDCAPYYKWSDFKDFYIKHMESLPKPTDPIFYDEEPSDSSSSLVENP